MAQYFAPEQLELASGAPLNGGKKHVYQTGTTTLLSLYSDEGLSTPTTNPLVADASGAFPEAFLAETECKQIITTSADVTVWTRAVAYTVGVSNIIDADDVSYDGTASGLSSETVQDALDEIIDLQGLTQSWESSANGVIATGTSTNTGAAGGPDLDLYRNSASPAASDVIGGVRFSGENASDSKIVYAKVQTVITDATNGSEDGRLEIVTKTNGSDNTATTFEGGKVDAANGFYIGGIKHGIKSGTVVASTSGTTTDFTDIPAGVMQITIGISGVSTNGNDAFLVQIGDSGGIESSAYVSTSSSFITFSGSLGGTATSTAGFIINGGSGTSVVHGNVILTLVDASTNTWVMSFSGATSAGNSGMVVSGGTKSLSGTLDRVRLTSSGGTDTFDAGKINILYE